MPEDKKQPGREQQEVTAETTAENATAYSLDGEKGLQAAEGKRLEEIYSKWMEGSGPEAEIVISSRIRLARNINGLPFPPLASDEQRKKVLAVIKRILKEQEENFSGMQLISINDLTPVYRQVLVEKHLISPSNNFIVI